MMRRFLRRDAVLAATGWGKSRLYEGIARGEFPKPIPLSDNGKSVAWDSEEVERWQQSRIAKREMKKAPG